MKFDFATPTSAEIDEAIAATEYKYFGDYELSEGQWGAVSVLVNCAKIVTSERDRILAILDRHPNAAPGWLALQIREGKL